MLTIKVRNQFNRMKCLIAALQYNTIILEYVVQNVAIQYDK